MSMTSVELIKEMVDNGKTLEYTGCEYVTRLVYDRSVFYVIRDDGNYVDPQWWTTRIFGEPHNFKVVEKELNNKRRIQNTR